MNRFVALACYLVLGVLAVFIAGAVVAPFAQAQSNRDNQRCFACHADPGAGTATAEGAAGELAVDQATWDHSVHSLLDCTSCHVGFRAREHTAAETDGWLEEAKRTACANCHAEESTMYEGSFHGKLAMENSATGSASPPQCADCHGSHGVLGVTTPEFRSSVLDMCGRCHGGRSETYLDTYHGQAFLLGDASTAVCTDCHGSHEILPASDPASLVSDKNIVATCATCHPGANNLFATYLVHVNPSSPSSSAIVWLFYAAYFALIGVIFTFGAVHSFLFFYRGRKEGMYRRAAH